MRPIDTIIVGQGLAGSILAWTLLSRGQRILIIDNSHNHSASIVAAGIINPITGKRFVLHPSTKSYLQAAIPCYQELEKYFAASFYHTLPMIRIFNSTAEVQQFEKRSHDSSYKNYLGKTFTHAEHPALNAPLGGFFQSNTAYLDIALVLEVLKDYFIQNKYYLADKLDYSDIKIETESVQYKSYRSSRLIFCEGYQLQNNPWFSSLPMVATKGEILSLSSDDFHSSHITNNGKWLLPIANRQFRFGASYEPHCDEPSLNNNNCRLLLDNLASMINTNKHFKLVNHQAGIRPCTNDRSPLIGMHLNYPRLGVFNGFGSKGAMMIPYFAQQFSHTIVDQQELQQKGNISRFTYDNQNNVFS